MSMSDISLSETSPAAAPAPARPPLPTEPPPFSAAAAAAPPAHAEAGAAAAAPSRELTAEQRADLAQLSQQVLRPESGRLTADTLFRVQGLGFRVQFYTLNAGVSLLTLCRYLHTYVHAYVYMHTCVFMCMTPS